MKKEIAHLQKEVSKLHIFELLILITVLFTILCLQAQYSRIYSYYQSSLEEDRQILLEMKDQNMVLQQFLSAIEAKQKEVRWNIAINMLLCRNRLTAIVNYCLHFLQKQYNMAHIVDTWRNNCFLWICTCSS